MNSSPKILAALVGVVIFTACLVTAALLVAEFIIRSIALIVE